MRKRDETERRLWDLFLKLKVDGTPVGPSSFAKLAGVSRAYLYQFHELSAAVSAYAIETQPRVSRRGAGVKAGEAKKRDIDERIRREHERWSKELPALKQKLEEVKSSLAICQQENRELNDQREQLSRVVELLLLLASEAGVSPQSLEDIMKKLESS
jgi:chromosome segregation ATPase